MVEQRAGTMTETDFAPVRDQQPEAEGVEALVGFTPSGRRGRFPVGTPVLEAARKLGVDIDSVCGGRGLCGRCQVDLSEGSFAKFQIDSRAGHLTAPAPQELRYAARRGLPAGRRLSCSARQIGRAHV